MTMKDYFDKEIKPLNDQLGEALGIKRIEVRNISKNEPVEVTRYVTCYGPTNQEMHLTELQFKNSKMLGLSVRGKYE